MILTISPREIPSQEVLNQSVLGHTTYAAWPHLEEVKVVSFSTEKFKYVFRKIQ